MAIDIAQLSLSIDSSSADKARASLAGLTDEAKKTEQATDRLSGGWQRSAAGLEQHNKATAQAEVTAKSYAAAQDRLNVNAANFAKALAAAGGDTRKITAEMLSAAQSTRNLAEGFKGAASAAVPTTAELNAIESAIRRLGTSLGTIGGAGAFGGRNNPISAFVEAIAAIGSVAPGLAIAATGLTAIGAAAAAGGIAINSYLGSARQLDVAVRALGSSTGLTADGLESLAKSAASAGNVSQSAGRAIVAELVRMGATGENLKSLSETVQNFAVAMGVTASQAAGKLGQALREPLQTGRELNQTFDVLTITQLEQIKALELTGQKAEAAQIIFDALNKRMQGLAAEGVSPLEQLWNKFKNQIIDSQNELAKWLLGIESASDRLKRLQAEASATPSTGIGIPGFETIPGATTQLDLGAQDSARAAVQAAQEAEAERELAAATAETTRKIHERAQAAVELTEKSDPLRERTLQLQGATELLQAAIDNGVGPIDRYRKALDLLSGQLLNLKTPAEEAKQQFEDLQKVLAQPPALRGAEQARLQALRTAERAGRGEGAGATAQQEADLARRGALAQVGTQNADAIKRQTDALRIQREVLQAELRDRDAVRAKLEAESAARLAGASATQVAIAGRLAEASVRLRQADASEQLILKTERETKAALEMADAYAISTKAVVAQNATAVAHEAFITGAVENEDRYRAAILARTAAQGAVDLSRQVRSLEDQGKALEGVAQAARLSNAAADDQIDKNRIAIEVGKARVAAELALENAIRVGSDTEQKAAEASLLAIGELEAKLTAATSKLRNEQRQASLGSALGTSEDSLRLAQAELAVVGELPAQQEKALAVMRRRLDLEREFGPGYEAEKAAILSIVEAEQDALAAAAERRAQIDAMRAPFVSLVQNIESGFTGMFQRIFSEGKFKFSDLTSVWKNIFSQFLAQITEMLLIRPLVSGLAQSLGMPGYGGGGFGGAAAFGGFSPGGAIGLAQQQQMFLQGGFGGSAGFPVQGGGFVAGPNVPGFIGGENSFNFGDAGGGSGRAEFFQPQFGGQTGSFQASPGFFGSLFPQTGFTALGALGGGFMGFGAGQFAGGLTGGSSLGSGIGGTIGGIAGSYFGPLGSLLGGLAGGALGGLFGAKPTTAGAGGNVNLGSLTAFGLAGNQQNLGAAGQLQQQVLQAAQQITQLTGGHFAPGLGVNVAQDTRGAFGQFFGDARFSGGSFFGRVNGDPATVVQQLTTQLLTMVQGVSGTMQTVLRNVHSLDELKAGAEFAKLYDSLTNSTEAATGLQKSVNDLNDQFNAAAAKASTYGLSIAAIEAARAKALEKLRSDFNADLDKQILEINQPVQASLNELARWRDQAIRDATAVGGNFAAIEQLYALKAQAILKQSTDFDLDVRNQILQITDPIQASLEELDRWHTEAIKQATALGGNLVQIEILYGLKREEIIKQANENIAEGLVRVTAVAKDLKSMLDRLLGPGDVNPDSPQSKYNTAFNAFSAAANQGRTTGMIPNDFQQVVDDFLTASRLMFASSEQYAADYRATTNLLKDLLGLPRAQLGGVVSGLTWVGERGPELVNMPGGARVYSHQESMRKVSNDNGGEAAVRAIEALHRTVTNQARQLERIGDAQYRQQRSFDVFVSRSGGHGQRDQAIR